MSWAAFEAAAPELARDARALVERLGFVYAGTVRRDGAPRISPVEARLVGGELVLVMIAGSRKVSDLARDPRITLQSPVTDPEDPGAELKLRGRVVEADETERVADAVEATSGWRPRPSWRFFAVVVDAVAVIDWESGEMVLRRWDRERGLRPASRRRLDAEASAYRIVGDR
jgi:Pyridoxamine 5'-phosphate oxidase